MPAALALSLLVMTTACGGSDGGGGGDESFVPNISAATWTNRADPTGTNTFFFLVDSPAKNRSTFTGNENPAGGGSQFHFSGSYLNKNIQFTYDSGSVKGGKSYTGSIDDSSRVITLSSASLGNLVLEKH